MRIVRISARHFHSPRYLFAFFLLAALLASLAELAGATRPLDALPISIENFGKVTENYYRGSQPDVGQFTELKRLGVKTIIDLRKDRLNEASEWARSADLHYINIPLTTKQPATDEQTVQFFKIVNDSVNWPVYVHCKGGRHRTGEMTALYRITNEGWTAEQAYQEMKKYDFEDSFFYPRSLKKHVFSYYQRLAKSREN